MFEPSLLGILTIFLNLCVWLPVSSLATSLLVIVLHYKEIKQHHYWEMVKNGKGDKEFKFDGDSILSMLEDCIGEPDDLDIVLSHLIFLGILILLLVKVPIFVLLP